MNCDGIPNLLQQPQSGLPTMTVTQNDLTMEEREDLEDQLIAVRDELLDRYKDPELVDLVYQLPGMAARRRHAGTLGATIPHLHPWCGTRHFDLTIDDSDENAGDEEDIGEDYGIAALVHGTPCSVHSDVHVREPALGPHHAEEELELVVPLLGPRETYQGRAVRD